jgi:hypothetical protein
LQPAQLVSIAAVPGVTRKAGFAEFAATIPLPHPAANSSAGANSIGRILESRRIVTNPIYILSTQSNKKQKRTVALQGNRMKAKKYLHCSKEPLIKFHF